MSDRDRLDGLLDGEDLVARISVRFSAGLPARVTDAMQPTLYRPSFVQRHAFADWAARADSVGFPVAGPEMIIGITAERVVVWRPAFLGTRPGRLAGAMALADIRRAGMRRRILASVLVMLFDDGTMVGVETLRTARLRAFATAIPTFSDDRAR
jgi:hypothetical protein